MVSQFLHSGKGSFCHHLILQSLEPIGSRAPNMVADLKYRHIERSVSMNMALFCEAQGYPVPSFRCVDFVFFSEYVFVLFRACWSQGTYIFDGQYEFCFYKK